MKKFSLALLVALVSSSAYAEDIAVRAKVIGSESSIGAKHADDDEEKSRSAFGYGADIEFKIAPQFRIGTGLAYTDYEGEKKKGEIGYSDFTWSGYGTVDFLNQDLLALYGTAGISYHNLSVEDEESNGVRYNYEDTGLMNYDLALGARVKLQENVHFGLEYKYTDTFSGNDLKANAEGFSLVGESQKVREDVTIKKNELVASVGYSF